MTNETLNNSSRLVEIDFFRGIALLVIFWNHLHWFVETGVPLRYGFSDMAATFVFLSGYVSGLVYWKVYRFKGFCSLLLKAGRRGVQIYAAHITALMVLLSIAVVLPATSLPNPMHAFLNAFTADSYGAILGAVSLQYFPSLFDILPLYIVFILAVPWVLVLLKIDWRISFGLSFALYCATQQLPALNLESYYPCWSLNPLSWFFLFATAITIAVKNLNGSLSVPVRRSYIAATICMLVYSFVDLRMVNQLLQHAGIVTGATTFLFPSPFPLTGKGSLQPVRLVHFFCLAYVVSTFATRLRPLCKSRFARPFVLCGQHSLALFSGGIVLTYLFAYFIVALGGSPILFYLFATLGWIVTMAFGRILSGEDKLVTRGVPFFKLKTSVTKTGTAVADGQL